MDDRLLHHRLLHHRHRVRDRDVTVNHDLTLHRARHRHRHLRGLRVGEQTSPNRAETYNRSTICHIVFALRLMMPKTAARLARDLLDLLNRHLHLHVHVAGHLGPRRAS